MKKQKLALTELNVQSFVTQTKVHGGMDIKLGTTACSVHACPTIPADQCATTDNACPTIHVECPTNPVKDCINFSTLAVNCIITRALESPCNIRITNTGCMQ